jgi:hypothetical protein
MFRRSSRFFPKLFLPSLGFKFDYELFLLRVSIRVEEELCIFPLA